MSKDHEVDLKESIKDPEVKNEPTVPRMVPIEDYKDPSENLNQITWTPPFTLPERDKCASEASAVLPSVRSFELPMSSGGVASLRIPTNITLPDWNQINDILKVLKPKQRRQRKKAENAE